MPSLAARAKIAQKRISRLPERRKPRLTQEEGGLIADATGTIYAPVEQLAQKDGGGTLYGYTERTTKKPDEIGGAYGRIPLSVTRDPETGLYNTTP